jgi:hypothetical protein
VARIIRIRADEIMAGDKLVVKEGSIRRYLPVCEVHVRSNVVEIIYIDRGRFTHTSFDGDDVVRVRD